MSLTRKSQSHLSSAHISLFCSVLTTRSRYRILAQSHRYDAIPNCVSWRRAEKPGSWVWPGFNACSLHITPTFPAGEGTASAMESAPCWWVCWLLWTSVQEIGPVVHDGASFLAKACERRVQSTRPILRRRGFPRASFHQEEVPFVLGVFPSIKQRVCFRVHTLQERVLCWIKPLTTSLELATFADLTRGKAELLAENALLRNQLIILLRQMKRPVYRKTDRLLLVVLARMVRTWKQVLFLVQEDDAASASIVSSSACSGSRNPRRTRESQGSRLRQSP
jgi:hypothetical protein